MAKGPIRIGIMSREEYAQRTLAIARGERRRGRNEPTVWFESWKSLAEVLSEPNQELLRLIEMHRPQSLQELERISGRKSSNLSRTLKTLEQHKLVSLQKNKGRLVPRARATHFQVDLRIDQPPRVVS